MSEQNLSVPVLAIDGKAGSGKGTAANELAKRLGFHRLDSGLVYRGVGLLCERYRVPLADSACAARIAASLNLMIEECEVVLNGECVTRTIRSEKAAGLAQVIAQHPEVRAAVMDYQLAMRKPKGLVADGRDMGVIFDTPYRYFLTCDVEECARRRVTQLLEQGTPASYDETLKQMRERDHADRTRAIAPLKAHPHAITIDTTDLSPQSVVQVILRDYELRLNARA